jgi:dTDP-4-dehydrorhamnose reductase
VTQRSQSSEPQVFAGVEVRGSSRIEEVIAQFKPAAVVNCIGIVKQRPEAEEAITSIEVNALLPHRLAIACRAAGARLVQLSTDCVFSATRATTARRTARTRSISTAARSCSVK